MATKLEKPVTREVAVKDAHGNDGVVAVTVTADGVTLRGKGTKREIRLDWAALAAAAGAPPNMPAKFSTNKLGWLVNKPPKKDEASAE